MVDGETTMAGAFNLATKGDGAQKYKQYNMEVERLTSTIEMQKLQKANFLLTDPKGNTINFDNAIQAMEKQLIIATQKRDESFQTAENVRTQTRVDKDGALVNKINELEAVQRNLKPAAAARLQPEIDALKTERMYLARAGMQSMDTFASTLDAPELEMPEIKQFRNTKLNEKSSTLTPKSADEFYSIGHGRFGPEVPAVINAPTSIKNEGDTHISTLSSTPSYSAANMLAQTWISAIGNPHATLNR
jgi:hypothetical protein